MKNFYNRVSNRNQRSSGPSKSLIPFRLNFLFIIVALLFAALIGQLAYLQIIYGSQLKAEVNSTDTTIETTNVQRGMVYDSNGKVLVGNKSHQAISYTKGVSVLSTDMYKIANRLGKYLTVSTSSLTPRQAIDYYLTDPKRLKAVENKLSGTSGMSTTQKYNKALSYLENDSSFKLTKTQKNAAEIFAKMSGAYSLSTTYIKDSGVSNKEIAEIGEHLSEMPGVKVGTSWSRDYPNGSSIKAIIGTVSSEKTGLPSDRVNELLAQGYSRNDSVGQSYLEQEYESVLRGTKAEKQVEVSGSTITKEAKKYGGQKGDNLQLTINSTFQKKLQSLVHSAESGAGGYSTGTYAIVMNPNTGGIVGMAGVDRNPSTGKITTNALGTINSDIVMGSVVKGAMVSGALMDGVITPSNNTLTDKVINVGGVKKASWFNKSGSASIALNASTALEVSSNSYMMQLAMKEAKFNYVSGSALTMSTSIFDKERGYFNQFGLGVNTGIDLPGESTGLKGSSTYSHIGNALDLSFGNYDAYTTLQVAQYMSTVANGGTRIAPHVVQSIRGTKSDGTLGAVKSTVTPKVLNRIDMTAAQKKLVTEGLYDVVHGTNTYKTGAELASISPGISAKTGTAETYYKGHSTVTLSLASYAPSNDPQVVVALAMPNLSTSDEDNNMKLAKQIYAAYWKTVQSTSTLTNPTKATTSGSAVNTSAAN
ncbi:peptidoglycan D,D-transpeptidase FtsI family protein [Levilactobacillus brevis]|uniref:Cell division protein FtsI/penicillin-binding protein 2 n=3 Tax=Levilactobacillus brevis TaxID=1580 RepID=Q03RN8_LEVBA|nr:penicillin-binding protein 2 [Levilactobacillus brevis]MBL3536551.1 penicillin-binding protein 2 [Lactobacillus sp. GPR40-2]MBL3629709.1 penicillin-binding protein 2 [Lactobacillus sp. GPB7-4]ABJ64134.1 Cell division protein FtsI/penicillin-binding protein 2 [Levilactobacillus brevis ATCC 367]ARQ93813.1 penicillin-binding protein [Levilactobacillus brevis]ARW21968.1 Peptidoglycan glycosyltransferase [Levilactobacillus brevis]